MDKYILNPKTNRLVLKTGRIGKQLYIASATTDMDTSTTGTSSATEEEQQAVTWRHVPYEERDCKPEFDVPQRCIHHVTPACNACCDDETLAMCLMCEMVGPYIEIERHVEHEHKPPEMPLVKMKSHRCECKMMFNTARHLTTHIQRISYADRKCPHDPETRQSYCDACMPTGDDGRVSCLLCNANTFTNKHRHWKNHRLTTLRVCTLCDREFNDTESAQQHLYYKHVMEYGDRKCGYPRCRMQGYTFLLSMPFKRHWKLHHVNKFQCPRGQSCPLGSECKSARQHVVMMGYHNVYIRNGVPSKYNNMVDLRPYWIQPSSPPALDKQIQICYDSALKEHERKCASRSYDNLPTELWIEIMKNMDVETLFKMRKVCLRTRAIANKVVKPGERFLFNLRQSISTDKTDMCVTRAKNEYMLGEPDLRNMIVTRAENPHYRSAAPMRLYKIWELEHVAMRKYRTWEAFVEAKHKKIQRMNSISANREKRREELTNALNARGLKIREDSEMCRTYITRGSGVNNESLETIVDIMEEMKFLYDHTEYQWIVSDARYEYNYIDYNAIIEPAKNRAVFRWRRQNRDVPETSLPRRVVQRLHRQLR